MAVTYQFDHFGIPVLHKEDDMIYYPEYQVWTNDPAQDPLNIERLYFEENSILHPLIQTKPHVCYIVNDIYAAINDHKILLAPIHYENYFMTFIEAHDVAIEFLQLDK